MRFNSFLPDNIIIFIIFTIMRITVYFNRKPCLRAIKIQDKIIDTVLSAEFISLQLLAF